MAILGLQLVLSLIVFSFLNKVSPYFSFARWLLRGRLVRYLHPTDEDLKSAAGIPTTNGKVKMKRSEARKQEAKTSSNSFTIPRNTQLNLDTTKVEILDLMQLKFYADYQWLLDFTLSAIVVYVLTEIYYGLGPKTEINISVLWCLLAIGFGIRILIAQTAMYFRTQDGGEKILCFTFGFFFLVASMGILVIDDKILEFGLEEGYNNFSQSAENYLKKQGITSQGPITFLTFKIILIVICCISGALLTFPGLRYARLHLDSLKYNKESPHKQVLLHLNFILPLIVILLWVKPIGRNIICGKAWKVQALIPEESFDIARLVLIAAVFVMRLCLMVTHMQAHLNLAFEKVESMRKESGRVTNLEIQQMITSVFYYLCVVALQYITPVIILLFLMFLHKTLGNYSWIALFGESTEAHFNELVVSTLGKPLARTPLPSNLTAEEAALTANQFAVAITNLRSVFSYMWYRGVLSFITWWVNAAWFTSTAFGVYYYSKLT